MLRANTTFVKANHNYNSTLGEVSIYTRISVPNPHAVSAAATATAAEEDEKIGVRSIVNTSRHDVDVDV